MNDTKIKFIILINELSFICNKILQSSFIKKIKGKKSHINISEQEHIKKITKLIINTNISLFQLRENLYTFQHLIIEYMIVLRILYLI